MAAAAAQLAPLFYADLRRLARGVRRGQRREATLQTTALIHEAYLKLERRPAWENRAHFLRAAALAMRQVLVDDARSRLSLRRGEGQSLLSLEVAEQCPGPAEDAELVELNEAMTRLMAVSPRLADVVECRFFAGYSEAETAEALGINERTVRRDWVKARAWLYRELSADH